MAHFILNRMCSPGPLISKRSSQGKGKAQRKITGMMRGMEQLYYKA